MTDRVIYKAENEKDFWKYWEEYVSKNSAGPKYLKTFIDYVLTISNGASVLYRDKSFVYLRKNKVVACVFLPIEKENDIVNIKIRNGEFVQAPLFDADEKLAEKIFNLIDEIARGNNVSKIMFSVDSLEKDKYPYNYLQKYNYLDVSILVHLLNTETQQDLLQSFRRSFRPIIRSILENKDFLVFYIDKDNPDYKIHKEYEMLHHKCSGRITRPQETFDIQYQDLKNGNAVLFGLKYKGKNVAYLYFQHSGGKAVAFSAADDPDYAEMPLYHALWYSAAEYFEKKGVKHIDPGQPSCPSTQLFYYPDEKQLSIGRFKKGLGGEFVNNFRGVKYFSRDALEKDFDMFLNNYKKIIDENNAAPGEALD